MPSGKSLSESSEVTTTKTKVQRTRTSQDSIDVDELFDNFKPMLQQVQASFKWSGALYSKLNRNCIRGR